MRGEHLALGSRLPLRIGSSPLAREHEVAARLTRSSKGSSPLARGARNKGWADSGGVGIIPACAGSTCCRGCRSPATWGSSPLARGALRQDPVRRGREGIIPACAGSTSPRSRHAGRGRDHPRLRGEHHPLSSRSQVYPGSSPLARGAQVPLLVVMTALGSSPLARGARHDVSAVSAVPGIIPACAGSTPAARARRADSGDHPRLRGEHRPHDSKVAR